MRAAGVDPGVWHLMTGKPYLVRAMGFGLRKPKVAVRGRDVGRGARRHAAITPHRGGSRNEAAPASRGGFRTSTAPPSKRTDGRRIGRVPSLSSPPPPGHPGHGLIPRHAS